MAPGTTSTIVKTIITPQILAKPDIVLLADTTGSMAYDIANVRARAADVQSQVKAVQPDARFGVAQYKDFNCDATPYRLDQALTDRSDLVQAAINTWFADGGCDGPEAQLNALYQLATDPATGWRGDSNRIVAWFGDAPGHDPSNGHSLAQVISALKAAKLRVIAVDVYYLDGCAESCGQATAITTATGGTLLSLATVGVAGSRLRSNDTPLSTRSTAADPTDVAGAILAGLQSLPTTVTPTVTSSSPYVTVTFDPPSKTVTSGEAATFAVTIAVAASIPLGTPVNVSIDFLADGKVITDTSLATPIQVTVPTAGSGATSWYFAEGYTGAGFDEFLTIQNPNSVAASIEITYYLTGAPPVSKQLTAPANSRTTVAVHDPSQGVGRNQAVSAKVASTNGIAVVVERPMYFTYQGSAGAVTDGHNVLGVQAPRQRWLFAEGYTGPGFDQFLTILNPHPAIAPVTITYFLSGGQAPVVKNIAVLPSSRYTVAVHETGEGVGRGQAVSAQVETSLVDGVVVERPMYFRYSGSMGAITGGHNVMGAVAPQPIWYFADGNTTAGFDQFLTLMNPAAVNAPVRLTYYVVGETVPRTKEILIQANSRYTVGVHDSREGVGRGVLHGTKVESLNGVGLVVEKPVYFQFGGVNGGSNVMGASSATGLWLFAEGYTGTGFDEYLTVLNPSSAPVTATITYYLASGGPVERTLAVPTQNRATVLVHAPDQVGRNQAVSVKVTSQVAVVAERAMYFRYSGSMGSVDGGHTALGYVP